MPMEVLEEVIYILTITALIYQIPLQLSQHLNKMVLMQ